MSLDSLFKPQSIALIGAAHTEEKLGGIILKNLFKFKGKVYPVNPKYKELMGIKAYPTTADIPEPVDLAIIMRPAEEVPEILSGLKGRTKTAIIMSSGFAEIGESRLQDEIKKIGIDTGVRLLGPNCMGLYNPHHGLDTFFLPENRLKRPKKGNVSVVSQSGAVLSCLLGALGALNSGVSKAVGYGNAVDIDETDLFEYLSNDQKTAVVISYVESVGDGRRFIEKAEALSRKKPFLVLKSGKGKSGQSAAFSHTGRLAGRYEVFHSVLKQFGIKEADDFDVLMDATKALAYQGQAVRGRWQEGLGNRVLIITNGGGSGVLAADECMRQELEVSKPDGEKTGELKSLFPHFYGINNPIDLTAQVRDEDYVTALHALKDDYDGFVIIALPNVYGITMKLAGMIKDTRKNIDKPMTFYIADGGISKKLIREIEKAKIPVYPSAERAVRGLKALLG